MTVRLYAGNLPSEVDRDAFEALFTSVAEVLSVKVVRDRRTNLCRGFAFVTVSTPDIAESLITTLHGTEFAGQTLKLEIAQPKEKESEAPVAQPEEPLASGTEVSGETSEEVPADRPRLTGKKRTKAHDKSDKPEKNTSSTSVEPDPRWASQLQRIKEQLMATGQS